MTFSWDYLLNPVQPKDTGPDLTSYDSKDILSFKERISQGLSVSPHRIAFLKGAPKDQNQSPRNRGWSMDLQGAVIHSHQGGESFWHCRDLQFPQGIDPWDTLLFDSLYIGGFKGLTLAIGPEDSSLKDTAHISLIQALDHGMSLASPPWDSCYTLGYYGHSLLETEVPGLKVMPSHGLPNAMTLRPPGGAAAQVWATLKNNGISIHPLRDDSSLILSFSPYWDYQEMDRALGSLVPLLRHSMDSVSLAPMPDVKNFPHSCGSCKGSCSSGGCGIKKAHSSD